MAAAVALNSFAGERGLLKMSRTARGRRALAASVDQLRRENAILVEEARRLREDPAAIEEIARRDFGFVRRGEIVVILRQPQARPPA